MQNWLQKTVIPEKIHSTYKNSKHPIRCFHIKNAKNVGNKSAVCEYKKSCLHSARNSHCVWAKNWQISVCGEWYANHSQSCPHVCIFGMQTICEWFGLQVHTALTITTFVNLSCVTKNASNLKKLCRKIGNLKYFSKYTFQVRLIAFFFHIIFWITFWLH